jgi:hypothetical protein
MHARFDSVRVPDDWKPDPNQVWDLKPEEATIQKAGGPVSHQQWKSTSADEVRENILLWFILMKL